jgi:hypothetical protein
MRKALLFVIVCTYLCVLGGGASAYVVTVPNGVYQIRTALDLKQGLDVAGAGKGNGTNIQLWECFDVLQQQFEFKKVSGTWYRITDQNSGKVLDVAGGAAASGTNVWLWEYNGSDAQLWQLEYAGKNLYYIKNKLGYYLDVAGGGTGNGNNIHVWQQNWSNAQQFVLWPTQPYTMVKDGTYALKSRLKTSKAVDVQGGGLADCVNIQLWDYNNTNAQKFAISHVKEGYYKIVNVASGKALNVQQGMKGNGVNVWQYSYNASDAQLWRFYKNESYYFIKNKNGYYLDVAGGATDNGTNIQIWEGNSSKAQQFKLQSTSVTPSTVIYYVATTAGLILRGSPSVYGAKLLTMPYCAQIEVSSISNGWAHCTYNGREGYCSSSYIKPISDLEPENSDLPSGVYFTQEGQTTCTLASAAMMLRTRAYQLGKNWQGVTESSVKGTAWINGSGLRWSFTYDGMSVAHASYYGMSLTTLKSLLDKNPAGIVLYCGNLPHAVWVISVSGDTVYCADPLRGYSGKKITLTKSYLGYRYSSQNNILSHVTAIWYVQ